MNRSFAPLLLAWLALAGTPALAQPSPGGKQGGNLSGTVLSVAPNSFVVVDKSGASITVPVTLTTVFQGNRAAMTYREAIRPGVKIKASAAPDGAAAEVSVNGMTTNLNLAQLQVFLRSSNEEWALLAPRIERVAALRDELTSGPNWGNGGGNGKGGAPSPMQLANEALLASAFDKETHAPDLIKDLKAAREARAKLAADLAAAQNELIPLLTAHQEALLVSLGIVD